MRTGFTLLEVVVALLILEVGLIGAFGILTTAGRALRMAEDLEAALWLAEGVADSLSAASALASGGRGAGRGRTLSWEVDSAGRFVVSVRRGGRDLLTVAGVGSVGW